MKLGNAIGRIGSIESRFIGLNLKKPSLVKVNYVNFSTAPTYTEVKLENLDSFETEVQNSSKPVVLDFFAESIQL